ncbi:iron-sulfur cluster insertion protein ErpA [Iodidimonas sp. SYSU 1G8]|uniref:iron-sulfur cluster insertion protein ErpA n=1 Tax=Iodidimonas sp. SYSU 1G8 TaxID=3133967 RepID=UPI0031FF31A2
MTVSQLVSVTDSAARRIAFLMQQDGGGDAALRVAVNGGGCSGFRYDFTFDDARQPDDLVIEKDGAVVLIDSMSQLYLAGAQIDFVEDVIGSSFQIQNPNASSSCGCGTSFSI